MAVINGTLADWPINPVTGRWEGDYTPPINQLIIEGSGLGTKAYPTQITQELFDGVSGELVSTHNPDWIGFNGNNGGLISDINPRFAGHKSAYNVATRDQFDTNYKTTLSRKGRTRLYSYWTRVNYRENIELGQIKFGRVTSSGASGGGGVYNEAGSQILNAPAPKSWNGTWTGSDKDAGVNTGYLPGAWFPANRWTRIEYEVFLNDLDQPNGFYNIHVVGYGSQINSNLTQRYSGFGKDNFLLDTIMLGIETVNTEVWVAPSVLTANTEYTYSAFKSGTTYIGTWTSSATVPTAAQVVDGIIANLIAAGMNPADIHTNPANTGEFGLHPNNSVTFGATLYRSNPISVQQGETYEDDDFKQYYVGNAPTWAACTETHPQPYATWTNTLVDLRVYVGGITGQKYLFLKTIANTTPTFVDEIVPDGTGWRLANA